MGRHKRNLDDIVILNMRQQGKTIKQISSALGVSAPTISRRIAVLKHEQGLLTKYRELQGLQLTGLQFRVLEAITPDKIKSASLVDLARAAYILRKAELSIQGKGSFRINGGLTAYLLDIEAEKKGVEMKALPGLPNKFSTDTITCNN